GEDAWDLTKRLAGKTSNSNDKTKDKDTSARGEGGAQEEDPVKWGRQRVQEIERERDPYPGSPSPRITLFAYTPSASVTFTTSNHPLFNPSFDGPSPSLGNNRCTIHRKSGISAIDSPNTKNARLNPIPDIGPGVRKNSVYENVGDGEDE
ncbi:hypothetical protein FRC10_003266, partial [Ceratobasidium sp. 414]